MAHLGVAAPTAYRVDFVIREDETGRLPLAMAPRRATLIKEELPDRLV